MPLNIHWKMPLNIQDDFRGVDFWCANLLPLVSLRRAREGGKGGLDAAKSSNFDNSITGQFDKSNPAVHLALCSCCTTSRNYKGCVYITCV